MQAMQGGKTEQKSSVQNSGRRKKWCEGAEDDT